jgi:hypothetical protein
MGALPRTTPFAAARRRPVFGPWRTRWDSLTPLAREVTVVLIVKAIVLGLLWWAFFRNPAAPHMTLDPQQVEQRILVSPTRPETPDAGR